MTAKRILLASLCLFMIMFFIDAPLVEGRYLPTRANTDRVDKLKELLKELLENEIGKEDYQGAEQGPPRWHPESKLFYKRDIPSRP